MKTSKLITNIIALTGFFALGTYLIIVSVSAYVSMFEDIAGDNSNFHTENACIQQQIAKGIERKDIKRNNGSCFVMIKQPKS